MNRLTHSDGGFRRALQISKSQIHAFVEGGPDRAFIDRILKHACAEIPYQIIVAKELPQGTGGKAPLITLFHELHDEDSLKSEKWGKRAVCTFFLDKDIDDLTGELVSSEHIIYTDTYDLEGHLIQNGDLVQALAFSSYMTSEQAKEIVGNKDELLNSIVISASLWLGLCIISKRKGLSISCNYSRQIPGNQYEIPIENDINSLGFYVDQICAKAGMSRAEFDEELQITISAIHNSIQQGRPLKYFKGKWFRKIFQDLAYRKNKAEDAALGGLGESIIKILISQTSPQNGCASSESYLGKLGIHFDFINRNVQQ